MLFPKGHLRFAHQLLIGIASCIFIFGCATNKPQININNEQDFSTINTFYVQPPLNSVNTTIENHVMLKISSILEKKGLTPSSKKNADVIVGFFPTTASKDNGKSVSFGLGTGVFGRSSAISLGSVFSVPVGEQVTIYQNLQIDMILDGTYIYSATGSAELDKKDSISIQNELTDLVSELLRPYPPKF